MKNDPRTGSCEHIIDQLPTSVACTTHVRSTLDQKTSFFLLNARARTSRSWNFPNLTFYEKAWTQENDFLFFFLSSVTVLVQHSNLDWKDVAKPLFVFSPNQKSYLTFSTGNVTASAFPFTKVMIFSSPFSLTYNRNNKKRFKTYQSTVGLLN